MKTFFAALIPVASFAACQFGIHILATRPYDRWGGWLLIILGALFFLASVLGWVADTQNRIGKLEEEVRRLENKAWDTPVEPSKKG